MRQVLSYLVVLGAIACFSGVALADDASGEAQGRRILQPSLQRPPQPTAPHQNQWKRWDRRRGTEVQVSVPELSGSNGTQALALLLGSTMLLWDRRRRVQPA